MDLREKLSALEKRYEEARSNNNLLKGQLSELYVLYNLTKILGKTFDLDQVIYDIFDLFRNTLSIQYASLYLTESVKQRLNLTRDHGFSPRKKDQLLFPSDSITEELLSQKKSTVKVLESQSELGSEAAPGDLPLYYLGLPIIIQKKRPVGILNFFRTEKSFSQTEVDFLVRVSQEVNNILDKMILFIQTQEDTFRDELTGAYNRRFFNRQIQAELKRAERYRRDLSLLMIDIDGFKAINDRFGHTKGDVKLKELSALIQSNLRKSDILIRYGGEEFVVLLPETNIENAYTVAEKLRREAENLLTIRNLQQDQRITISIGVSNYPLDSNVPDELIQNADKRLYQAKKSGKNRTVVGDKLKVGSIKT